MGKATFNVCCLGSALEPNQFFLSFFLSEWQKAQKYTFARQEMALNIVLGGQEDCFLMNVTRVCALSAPQRLLAGRGDLGCAALQPQALLTEEPRSMSLGGFVVHSGLQPRCVDQTVTT